MKVNELINLLSKLDGDKDVMILDLHNGGGCPREINFNAQRTISQRDADNAGTAKEG